MKNFRLIVMALAFLPVISCLGADVTKKGKDSKSGLSYEVNIDEENIVLELGFSGPLRLMQVVQNGFELYVNENGKKKTDMGLIVEGNEPRRPRNKNGNQERGNNQNRSGNRNMPQPGELPEGFDPENMPPMPPMGMMPDFDENNDKSENASAEKKTA